MLHGNLKLEISSLMPILDDFSIKTGLDAPLSHVNLYPRLRYKLQVQERTYTIY